MMKLGTPELWELEAPTKITKTMPAKIADYCDGNTFGNVAYINEDNQQVNILGQYDAGRMILSRFGERYIDIPVKLNDTTKAWELDVSAFPGVTPPPTTVAGYISALWTTYWFNNNMERYKRIYEVLTMDYEPLVNYDKDSTITTTHGKVTTKSGSLTHDVNIFGVNSGAGGADSDTTTTTYNSLADTNSGIDTVHDVTTGNIGTVTAQYMALQELEVRKYNLTVTMVEEFINYYTHY